MKTSKILGAFIVALTLIFSYSTVSATAAVSTKESRQEIVKKVLNQNSSALVEKIAESKFMKRSTNAFKLLAKKFGGDKVDFQTEPDRWMWFWLAGWAAGLVLSVFGFGFFYPLWYLGSLCWLAGSVCLIIWLLKKTGNM